VIAVAAAGGATVGVGLVIAIQGARPRPAREARADGVRGRLVAISPRRLMISIAVPLLVGAVTGWPVAAALALVAAVLIPQMWDARRTAERRLARLEGLALWTRRLADLLAAGAGLEQALATSVRSAPAALAPDINRLAWRLRATGSTQDALRGLAVDVSDPTGDLVVAALLLASERRGRGLAGTLTALATTVDAEVAMRRQVEADRAGPRTTVRYVLLITLVAVSGLVLFDRSYLAPFATLTGQVALGITGGMFGLAFVWMHRLTSEKPGLRFIGGQERPR
jgi:tight adherence protein B